MEHKRVFIILILLFLAGCLKPYEPDITIEELGNLVVEGVMDISDDTGQIVLSRTKKLDIINQEQRETGANVWIEDEQGNSLAFIEENNGVYIADFSGYVSTENLTLHIITSDNLQYSSDTVDIISSPPIDSVTWKANDEGLTFYVNTHDPTNSTTYYRWEYVETAEYNSYFLSRGIYDEALEQVVTRDQETQNIYICWDEQPSKEVIIGNTSAYSEDIIINKEVNHIPTDSWKHRFRYSLLVKQYAITAEEYDYWYNIQQTNENTGSIFETQPANIPGNLKADNASDEQVFGYFSISKTTQERIFVNRPELPDWERAYNIPLDCDDDDEVFVGINTYYADPDEYEVIEIIYSLTGEIAGITTADDECIVCSYGGRGSHIKPDYW